MTAKLLLFSIFSNREYPSCVFLNSLLMFLVALPVNYFETKKLDMVSNMK